MSTINWSKFPSGVHQAPFKVLLELLPELKEILETFPDNPYNFTWDVKIHMLMPRQYPCIPNWHVDAVPRVNGVQRFDLIKPELPMYLWVSGAPLTQFKHGYISANVWHRFNQTDEHRGTAADSFKWRCMIRATHKDIQAPKDSDYLRRHSQVYVDSETFQW